MSSWKNKKTGITSEDIAAGFLLLDLKGWSDGMVAVAEHLREGTQAGQTIQAFSILGRLTPEGMVICAMQQAKESWIEANKFRSEQWLNQHKGDFDLTQEDIDYIQRRVSQANALPDGRDKNILLGEISARLQKQNPAAGWCYVSFRCSSFHAAEF